MKKSILALVLLVATVGITSAQDLTKREVREEQRQAREAKFIQQANTAINNQSFTFMANTMSPLYGNDVPLGFTGNNIMEVTKNFVEVSLPYQALVTIDTPVYRLDFMSQKYKYTSVFANNQWNITIEITNAINNQASTIDISEQYTMNLTFNAGSRTAVLVIMPKNNTPVTYTGTISFTN